MTTVQLMNALPNPFIRTVVAPKAPKSANELPRVSMPVVSAAKRRAIRKRA
jgi:hypothetical protein